MNAAFSYQLILRLRSVQAQVCVHDLLRSSWHRPKAFLGDASGRFLVVRIEFTIDHKLA